MNMNVPKKMFLTKGAGIHKDRLASFELVLCNELSNEFRNILAQVHEGSIAYSLL